MDQHGTEASGHRNLLNGLVTAATKSWRHGLQQNGHTSNAMVFPTIATTVIASSPTNRTHATENITMAEEQHRRLQQQRHQDHRLNVLWYGGDDVNQQNRTADDWEKQPLRQQQQKSQKLRSHQILKIKRPVLPGVPIVWAAVLLTVYALAMAVVYQVYGSTTGSGWVWFRGIVGNSSSVMWLWQVPATWYYLVQAFCAATVGFLLCQWCCQQEQQQKQFYYYLLLMLFGTALFPSVPIAEIFNNNKNIVTSGPLDNSTTGKLQQLHYYNSEQFDENRLTLYEGLWQVTFFVFLAYCLVLPMDVPKKLGNQNDKHINEQLFNGLKNIKNDENRHVTVAVLFFTIIASIGHTFINAYFAYNWYFQRQLHQENSLIKPVAAFQQLIANTVVLTSINLIGWLLRQSVVRDRADIKSNKNQSKLTDKHNLLRFTLRQQAHKLNLLLTSLLPRRVFSQMKYEIVADAARSYDGVYNSNKNDHFHKSHLQHPQEELQLLSPQSPKMYLKEYDNVSIVSASITGFWDNVSAAASHGESGFLQSRQLITLVDRLMADLYRRMAQRNHCLPIRLLGHRSYFVAGLPSEESYGFENDENTNCKIGNYGHARNAIQMGLDLINAINMVVHDVSRRRYGHKINLNIRVGIHSGRVTCGVLGFAGGMDISSEFGSRWQYEVWGRDVLMASEIESNGRPGWVHVSQATVDHINKTNVPTTAVSEKNYAHPGVIFRDSKNTNCSDYTKDYTFEHGGNLNRINTYFVVPKTICPNSEMHEDITRSYDYDDNDNLYGDDIESLILQSVDRQLRQIEIRKQYDIANSILETEMISEPLLPTSTTTVGEVPVVAASMISGAAPGTTMKMIMNRHRRSRYEQEPLQSSTKNNSSFATTDKEPPCRWEKDVFEVNDNYNLDKVRSKSDDDDLFRLAKSQLLLLCVIITLFVVNVTTMPWTMLLGITFITPFVVTAGELIYVMALLIGWVPRPRMQSTTYIAATIADDYEYYHHYDDDNNDSDSSSSSESVSGCLSRLFICRCPRNCSIIGQIFKPFRKQNNNVVTTRNPLDDNKNRWWCIPKWCHCCNFHNRHCWFARCLGKNRESSCVSSDDSDIESRLGFRNEHAVMAAVSGASPSQQQMPNRSLHTQSKNNKHSTRLPRQRHSRLKRKYQDEERHTWFFWIAACNEVFVVLLICLLALLNAFTCEPVMMTNAAGNQLNAHNSVNNNSGRFNSPIANITQQQYHSPLTCPWPQYAVLTCCLACISIAIAFPIYYGSLPTLRMKIGTLLVMTFVFAIAFVHFTHQHVFHAASISSLKPSCCSKFSDIHNYQKVGSNISNNTNNQDTKIIVRRDLYQENKRFKLQEEEQHRVAGLDTATTTIYVVTFAAALLIYFVYAHRLKDRRAHHQVKMHCDERRLGVLRMAHQRTLHSFIPDHVALSLQNSCHNSDINLTDSYCGGVNQPNNNVFVDPRSIPMTVANNQGQRDVVTNISRPLYYCGYRAVVVIFATIVQQDNLLTSNTNSGESRGYFHRQLGLLNEIFSEFDQFLDSQTFYGLVEKIKMVGTNTYMAAVGLQHQHGPERQLVVLLREMKRRNMESFNYNNQDKKSELDSCSSSKNNDPADGYELYDVISANYVMFALDFIRYMRRILHRRQIAALTSAGNVHVSQSSQLALRVGVNVGPVVAGLIGCNDGTWKQPKFDVWGNTVNVARQMDTTGVAGSTQVTNCVVDVMKSIKDPKYEFDIRTKATSKDNKRITYFVRENFDRNESVHPVQQQQQLQQQQQQQQQQQHQFSIYHQLQFQQNAVVHKNHNLEPHRLLPYKHVAAARSPQNAHRVMTPPQFDHEQSTSRPIVTVHPQHSYYNAKLQQQMRQQCVEPIKTPPPPPKRSPLSANMEKMQHNPYPMLQQHSGAPDQYSDPRQWSRGVQKQRAAEVTYARPMQQHKSQKQANKSCQPQTDLAFPRIPEAAGATCSSDGKQQQQQQMQQRVCRPNALALVKNFDADRPLPAPPRTSDTVTTVAAGRPRHHHDPRRRRRGPPHHQHHHHHHHHHLYRRDDEDDDGRPRPPHQEQSMLRNAAQAWPSSSTFRPSSTSSSGSADAGNTTASNNNYHTTTTATSSSSSSSSSDESFGPVSGVRRSATADVEDFDMAASSAAVSPVHRRYRHLFRQWSPAATAGSSPVRRSSSFRSPPTSGGDLVATVGPASPRTPPGSGAGCTQSLNRRRARPMNAAGCGAGGSSGRRKRRRQQQQTAGASASPLQQSAAAEVAVETPASPPSSLWKKQHHRVRPGGGPVASPDFTDEIRRILLLDQHRGNVRQQRGAVDDVASPTEDRPLDGGKDKIEKDANRLPSPVQQPCQASKTTSTDRKSDKNDENHNRHEDNGDDKVDPAATVVVPEAIFDSDMSSSSFKERERQMTEQVKRQEAEVRRILQAQKNNPVTVAKGTTAVTPETRVLGCRQQATAAATTAESSEWSDDESLEPLSLQDDRHPGQCSGFIDDYVANSRMMNAAELTSGCEGDGYTTGGDGYTTGGDGYTTGGDGYTTGGDGDGYTTTGYTTDDAAAATDIAERMHFVRTARLPITSARHLDDNLSTMNDTGLTDAEAALSDVNSMIEFNDGYDSNQFESRRQSSLSSSSVCPYASDSLCDDDDYNDEGEFNFNDDYDVDDDKPDSCDDDDFNHRHYNLNRLLQQQQMFLSQPATSPSSSSVHADNNKKSFSQQQQQQQSQTISFDTTLNAAQKPDTDTPVAATTTAATSVSMAHNTGSSKSTAATSTINTTTASTNTEPVEQSSAPTVRNADSNSNKSK